MPLDPDGRYDCRTNGRTALPLLTTAHNSTSLCVVAGILYLFISYPTMIGAGWKRRGDCNNIHRKNMIYVTSIHVDILTAKSIINANDDVSSFNGSADIII